VLKFLNRFSTFTEKVSTPIIIYQGTANYCTKEATDFLVLSAQSVGT
jgi:hypothetical protein